MSGGRDAGERDVSTGIGVGITGAGFAGVVAEPVDPVTTVDVDVDEATATVSAAFSVFTEHAVAANRNAMERRINGSGRREARGERREARGGKMVSFVANARRVLATRWLTPQALAAIHAFATARAFSVSSTTRINWLS